MPAGIRNGIGGHLKKCNLLSDFQNGFSVMKHLICSSKQRWMLNSNLIYETLWKVAC